MANANTYQMNEIGKCIDYCVSNMKKDITSLAEEALSIQSEFDTVKSYNGMWLKGEERDGEYSENSMQKRVYGKKAIITSNNESLASSGLNSFTRGTKDTALDCIEKILTFVNDYLPAVIECIDKNIDEVESTLSQNESNGTGTNQPFFEGIIAAGADAVSNIAKTAINEAKTAIDEEKNKQENNQSADPNNPTPNEDDNSYVPTGPGSTKNRGGGGGGSLPSGPSYRKPSDTKTTTKPTPIKSNVTAHNFIEQETKTNTTILFSNNSSTTPNTVTAPNTVSTPTSPTRPTEPSTGTDSDNPTPTAVVTTGGSGVSHTGVSSNPDNPTDTPIEILGEDPPIPTKEMEDIDSLGDSIISGVSRVLPETGKGGKVQQGSALIPGVAGLGAAAAAGLGSKTLLDRTDNSVDTFSADEKELKDDEHTSIDDKKDDKGWLYGMGIGLGALGAGVAKHEKDKKDEDYEIADDTPPEQETLEDD